MKALWMVRPVTAVVMAAATVLHFTVRDGWQPLAAFFYATPWPILALGWGLVGAWSWPGRLSLGCAGLAVASAGFWFAGSWHGGPAPAGGPALKVLCWNMAHRSLPGGELEVLLHRHRPDVTGLVEVGLRHGDPNPLVKTLPPGFTSLKLHHGMAVIVRGACRVLEQRLLPCNSKFARLEAVVDGQTWQVFVVDGVSKPVRSRRDALAAILHKAQGQPRTILMGDFNTPPDSVHFDAWRQGFRLAHEQAGRGLGETWPRWVPVLALDHVWSSLDAPPLRAGKLWSPASDHAALLVELGR